MIAGDDLHRLLDKLMALIFKLLPVAVLAGVHTATEVVVLWRRRRRTVLLLVLWMQYHVWKALTDHHPQAQHR